jgi:hypothetical protein
MALRSTPGDHSMTHVSPHDPLDTQASDPLRALRRGARLLWLVTVSTLIVVGLWALRPLEQSKPIELPSGGRGSPINQDPQTNTPPIDAGIFAVNLWNLPPALSATSAESTLPSPPAKPLNVQLIGIITEDGVAKAALYDADNDRLLIVDDGQTIGDRTLRIVEADSLGGSAGVEINDGLTKQVLLLRPEKGNS